MTYTYGDASWGDLLTKYGSTTITYDAIENPQTIGSQELTWQGRELQSYTDEYYRTTYTYNADGIRTSKETYEFVIDYVTRTEYMLVGSQIVGEIVYFSSDGGTNFEEQYTFIYLYDESGAPIGLKYRTPSYAEGVFDCYFFEKNLQGDIVAIYNESGTKVGSYTYDAWGKCTATSNTSGYNFILYNNPFRYRGYYYDTETGLYYLQSRYYNPTWGRFLNADGYINANGDLIGFNMFAYCSNNPVMFVDYTGSRILPFWELSFPGEIHNEVVKKIVERTGLERVLNAEVRINSKSRADLVDFDSKEIYEVKPVTYLAVDKMNKAFEQIHRYIDGFNEKTPSQGYHAGESIPGYKFQYKQYLVSYWYYKDGLILYSFKKIKFKEEKKEDNTTMAPATSLGASDITAMIAITAVGCAGGGWAYYCYDLYSNSQLEGAW